MQTDLRLSLYRQKKRKTGISITHLMRTHLIVIVEKNPKEYSFLFCAGIIYQHSVWKQEKKNIETKRIVQ